MKERPILFSAPMVRALLDGSKTQTRRVCKPAEAAGLTYVTGIQDPSDFGQRPLEVPGSGWFGDEEGDVQFRCPYGKPGDRLWVRETFQPLWAEGVERESQTDWKTGKGYAVSYPATDGVQEFMDGDDNLRDTCKPSIHMPRWASRILLEIVSVRVERLQDISDQDAIAEGIERVDNNYGNGPAYCDYGMKNQDDTAEWFNSPIDSYQSLWESINGAGSWGANPWVWVVEFNRVAP